MRMSDVAVPHPHGNGVSGRREDDARSELMRDRHRADDVCVITGRGGFDSSILGVLTLALVAIASISLPWPHGIMNVMLVAVAGAETGDRPLEAVGLPAQIWRISHRGCGAAAVGGIVGLLGGSLAVQAFVRVYELPGDDPRGRWQRPWPSPSAWESCSGRCRRGARHGSTRFEPSRGGEAVRHGATGASGARAPRSGTPWPPASPHPACAGRNQRPARRPAWTPSS
jgi:hypothetical protein